MEWGGQKADPSASIRLALNLTPKDNLPWPSLNDAMNTLGLTDPFTKTELIAAIEATKKHSSPGYDQGEAIDALLQGMNQVWAEGIIPPERKHSVVVLIPKPGKLPTSLQGLRPICLTPTVCKLFERMLATRLSWWLEYHKKYHSTQIGFRVSLGTKDGLAILADEVLHVSPHSHLVRTVVATDIAKAYDNIQPEIILRNTGDPWPAKHVTKVVHSFLRTAASYAYVRSLSLFASVRSGPLGAILVALVAHGKARVYSILENGGGEANQWKCYARCTEKEEGKKGEARGMRGHAEFGAGDRRKSRCRARPPTEDPDHYTLFHLVMYRRKGYKRELLALGHISAAQALVH
ncbi:hypothetical protein HPB47_020780 [Ixodes persulcatus]|uniref:Uncharacterized protein n=1 Tax=Ixodes persulcatus TaxID=34615 RepID=A0AC60QF96_IXOPE|nr:hypothetical protein HPB47_020780 [Ixodes persulcatus]